MAENVHYEFLPYVRRGFAAALSNQDTLGLAPMPALATFDVSVPVVASPDAVDPTPVRQGIAVSGPGDVTGLTTGVLVRTWPANGATDAEANFFPLVEFDHPDLPWLFTPAAPASAAVAGGGKRLRPWLVLVVVEQGGAPDDARLERGESLPRLVVPTAAAWQLPDLRDSWLWAHAQVTPLEGETVEVALAADPRRNLSRLLCPRRLRPETHYLACVVPAFDIGRKAGLGAPVEAADERELAPAFAPGIEATLPVYCHWAFATGGAGDFETLARRLHGRKLPDGVGRRALDVSHPGPGLPVVADVTGVDDTRAVLMLEGALRHPQATPAEWAEPERTAFVSQLTEILDAPARLAAEGGENGDGPRMVAPPIYGQFHAACATLGSGNPPPWLVELNLDPNRRVTAGAATQVVQDRQEDLVARAWVQVGEILDANRALRLAQLARAAATSVHTRCLRPLAPADLVGVTAAVHSRVREVLAPGAPTLAATIHASRLPRALASTAFRRLARPRGLVARASAEPETARRAVGGVADGTLPNSVSDRPPDGTVGLRSPSTVLGAELAQKVLATLEGAAPAGGPTDRLDRFVDAVNAAGRRPPTGRELATRGAVQGVTAALAMREVGVVRPTGGPRPGRPPDRGTAIGGAGGPIAAGRPTIGTGLAAGFGRKLIDETVRAGHLVDSGGRPDPAGVSPGPTDAALLSELLTGAIASADRDVVVANAPDPPERPPLDLAGARRGLLASLDPERTIVARIDARLTMNARRDVVPADPLEPVMASPIFHDPMYEPLRDLSEEWLLPGLQHVPLDTATLVETNPAFVAAYLVGLNHEFARELLWREYPTDQRGTCFARFWGRADTDDVRPIHRFHDGLADNVLGGRPAQLVLLVRGELLHRYPGAIVYAAQGRLTPDGIELHSILPPDFRGTLRPDTTFLGFRLTVDDVLGPNAPDWWFVIAEHPTEPRFGLDEEARKAPTAPDWTWNDLAWPHLVDAGKTVDDLVHAPAAAPALASRTIDGVRWGADAAGQAHATFQQPVRVAIRAKPLLEAATKP
jgi:hypothetical protein